MYKYNKYSLETNLSNASAHDHLDKYVLATNLFAAKANASVDS